jgi:hypothetical protein
MRTVLGRALATGRAPDGTVIVCVTIVAGCPGLGLPLDGRERPS